MIKAKLIVILLCLILVTKSLHYCEICPNHVFCHFTMPGPNVNCREYSPNNLLTNKDVEAIVKRINEKRNFIASGLSRYFPKAANMNKIYWSDELAAFAQRWVDQCDPDVQPDKEDECRDLDGTKVGQNIVSIIGPSPGMIIQSLIDVWFTQGLDFRGNLSCYNYLRDTKTNYFTQLIWAETNRVGCGKAKFYLKNKNTMVERLVCNFAPKGNIHGQSVYAFGFSTTQCRSGMTADNEFAALCGPSINKARNVVTQKPAKSLLRILNLSSNSTNELIERLGNNLEQIKPKDNHKRYQKIRHVTINNSNVYFKKLPEIRTYDKKNIEEHDSKGRHRSQSQHLKNREHIREGNSGHVPHENDNANYFKHATRQILKQHSFTAKVPGTSFTDFATNKYLGNRKCTRRVKSNLPLKKEPSTCCTSPNRCTRKHCPKKLKDPYITSMSTTECTHTIPQEECPCNTPTKKCKCNNNCQCLNIEYSTQLPATLRLSNVPKAGYNNPAESYYYDLYPHLAVRSRDKHFETSDTMLEESWNRKKSAFDREKRSADEVPLKPFWQIEKFDQNRPLQLKAIKYTTLSYKKHRNMKRTSSSIRIPQTTEAITVKLKHASNSAKLNPVTEKYLSFDELMHLRKYGSTASITIIDGRRNEPNKTVETSEYTTNTPFVRKKHCTRKLTCTWTAASITGANGSIIDSEGDFGSRTPPGYVEGCTRTSTCTRDNMHKNKFSTLQEDVTATTQLEDEDYCEKRALNIRKRDSQSKDADTFFTVTILPLQDFSKKFMYSKSTARNFKYGTMMPNPKYTHDCHKDNQMEIKKLKYNSHVINTKNVSVKNRNSTPFSETFYLLLKNIIRNGHDKISFRTSSAILLKGSILLVLFILFYNVSYN